MADKDRKRLFSKEQLRSLIQEENIKTTDDIQRVLKEMFGDVLQEALDANWVIVSVMRKMTLPARKLQIAATDIPQKQSAVNTAMWSLQFPVIVTANLNHG